jgi:hypothetical protein
VVCNLTEKKAAKIGKLERNWYTFHSRGSTQSDGQLTGEIRQCRAAHGQVRFLLQKRVSCACEVIEHGFINKGVKEQMALFDSITIKARTLPNTFL